MVRRRKEVRVVVMGYLRGRVGRTVELVEILERRMPVRVVRPTRAVE